MALRFSSVLFLGLLLLSACSKKVDLYEYAGLVDAKPSPPPASLSAPEPTEAVESISKLYGAGLSHIKEGSYSAALKDFQEVERVHPYSGWAARSLLMQAYAQYLRNEYDETVALAQRFMRTHPGHEDVGYAYYLLAIAYYEQISDAQRDQLNTQKAVDALDAVVEKFPDTSYGQDAKRKAAAARSQLAAQDMGVGRYYLERQNYLAAVNRFKTVVEKYPASTQVPEALYRLVGGYLSLGITSEAQMAGLVLREKYPGSEWEKEAQNLLAGQNLKPQGNNSSWMKKTLGAFN